MKDRTMRTLGLGAGIALTVAALTPVLASAQDVPAGAAHGAGRRRGRSQCRRLAGICGGWLHECGP